VAKPKTKELLLEIGGSGTNKYSGYISEDYNPELTFPNSIQKFDIMRKGDGTASAVLKASKAPILGAKWSVLPASEEKKDIEIADFVEYVFFEKLVWADFLNNALLFFDFGFSLSEKIFEIENGKIIYKKLAPRLPKSVQKWQMSNGEAGIMQYADNGTGWKIIDIPQWKIFHLANDQEGDNYEGVSLLRGAYKHWYFKENFYKIQAIGAERSGTGIPKATFPESKTPTDEEMQETITTLQNLRGNEDAYIVETGGIEFSFATVGGNSTFDFEPGILHHDRQIEKSVLVQFLSIGVTKGGNAQNEGQQSLAYLSAQAVAEYISDKVNRELVKEIVDLNFPNVQWYPKITVGEIGPDKLGDLSVILQRIAQAGLITPDQQTENTIRKMLKFPEKQEEVSVPVIPPKEVKEESKAMIDLCGHAHTSEELAQRKAQKFAEDKVDWKKLEKFFDAQETSVQKILEKHGKGIQDKVAEYLEERVATGSSLTMPTSLLAIEISEMQSDIEKAYITAYEFGKTEGAREMAKARITTPDADRQFIADHSYTLASKYAEDMKNEACLSVQNSVRSGIVGAVAIAKKAMIEKSIKQIESLVPILVTGGVNQGIGTVYQNFQEEIWGWEYVAVLDSRTSPLCLSLDGRVSRNAGDLPKPPCHFRCRSRLVAILRDEKDKPEETGVPEEIKSLYKGQPFPYKSPEKAIPVSPDSPAAKIMKP
jgi:hypothetical protein